ncbi:MAG: RNA repair domain-containing protein [Candidatus Methanofastidiosia archaeon]|jgi:uncharacterized protein (UPF0248 family)
MRPREFLNKLKWHPEYNFEEYSVVYVHRGAPNDEKTIECTEIIDLEHSDMILEEGTHIPYHRVKRILDSMGRVVWKKPE